MGATPKGPAGSSSGFNETGQKIAGYKVARHQNFTPEQMQLFQSLFSKAGPDSYLSRLAGGDQGMFDEIEAPALRQFQGLQGNLASRFSGMGIGARRGSGFQNASGQLTSNFAQDLSSRRHSLQRQALMDLLGLSNELLGKRPHEDFLIEPAKKKRALWESLLGGALPVGGALLGGALGGPGGAALGGSLGSTAAQSFLNY